jgi:hypothetical protein
MGSVFRPSPPPQAPAPAPVYAAPTKAEVSQVTSTSTIDMKKSQGRSSTILTGAKGLGDNALTTSKKSLLGG